MCAPSTDFIGASERRFVTVQTPAKRENCSACCPSRSGKRGHLLTYGRDAVGSKDQVNTFSNCSKVTS